MPIGKKSIERAAMAVKEKEGGKAEAVLQVAPILPEEPVKEKESEKKPASRRGRKPGSKNKPKVKTAVIANVSPEAVEKVAKPRKAKKTGKKVSFAIGDDLPEYLL